MKILFVANRAWDDLEAVDIILDQLAGDEPVEIVSAYDTRGPEAQVAEWVRKRAKVRRTTIDHIKAGKQFATVTTAGQSQWASTRTERLQRRDDYLVNRGGYDLVVALYKDRRNWGGTERPLEIARRMKDKGVKTLVYTYWQNRTEGTAL